MPEVVNPDLIVDQLFRISRDLGQQRMYRIRAEDDMHKAEEQIKALELKQASLRQQLKEAL